MRPFSRRLRKQTITHHRRIAPSRRPTAGEFEPEGTTLSCAVQPLGDTGRRVERWDEHMRIGARDSWRAYFGADEAARAGLDPAEPKAGDRWVFNGRPYVGRGGAVPQMHGPDGTVLSWSVDIDGID